MILFPGPIDEESVWVKVIFLCQTGGKLLINP